jgi:hypothetical protein
VEKSRFSKDSKPTNFLCKPDANKKKAPTDQSSNQGQWGHKTLAGLQIGTLPRGIEATLAQAEWFLSIRKTTVLNKSKRGAVVAPLFFWMDISV